jgi:hypothetical protein
MIVWFRIEASFDQHVLARLNRNLLSQAEQSQKWMNDGCH